MNILVFGGTGAMGRHLVTWLANGDNKVFVTSRSRQGEDGNQVTYINGDAHETIFLKSLMRKKWDTIVDFMFYNSEEFSEKLQLLLGNTSQYIYISSARVYNNAVGKIDENSDKLLDVSEDLAFLATDDYAIAKARQENLLIESGYNNWTIIRPYITYSSNRLQLGAFEKEDWLYRVLKGRTLVFSHDIADKFTVMTCGADVSYRISKLVGCKESYGQIFQIAAPNSYRWDDILKLYTNTIYEVTGNKPNIKMVDDALDLTPQRYYQIQFDRKWNRSFDCKKIDSIISEHAYRDLDELSKNLKCFLSNPEWQKIDWKVQAAMDRITGEHTSFNEIYTSKEKIQYAFYRKYMSYRNFTDMIMRKNKIKWRIKKLAKRIAGRD